MTASTIIARYVAETFRAIITSGRSSVRKASLPSRFTQSPSRADDTLTRSERKQVKCPSIRDPDRNELPTMRKDGAREGETAEKICCFAAPGRWHVPGRAALP